MLATFRGGGLGGGTVDSLLGFKSISRDERRAAADPYGLNPPNKRWGVALAAPSISELQHVPLSLTLYGHMLTDFLPFASSITAHIIIAQ